MRCARMRARCCVASAERVAALEHDNRRLRRRCARLERDNARLREELARLKEQLEASRRAAKRQAAPFSKGPPKPNPRRPGRRAGPAHGRHAHRTLPTHVDEQLDAPLPACCPRCQGPLEEQRIVAQYHTELPPVRPHVTRFDVHVGRCRRCGARVQGRHPRQRSDALGAAASQLGPRALALGAYLHKGLGLPLGKCTRLYAECFGITLTPGGLCQAVARGGAVAEPTYRAMLEWLRAEPVVSPDETGWKVAGRLQWLWVFVSRSLTVYSIAPGRGFEQAALILGEHYAGILVRDGWAPYRRFEQAGHQTCLAHITRRNDARLEAAERGAARVPRALKRILDAAFALRARRDAGKLSEHGLRAGVGRLRARLERLLAWRPTDPDNARLLRHLAKEHAHDAVFTFLLHPEVAATNYLAEQAIRPAVVTRKVCGGNRTARGARTQEVLASFFQTSRQQRRDPIALLVELLCAPAASVAEVLAPPPPSEHPRLPGPP